MPACTLESGSEQGLASWTSAVSLDSYWHHQQNIEVQSRQAVVEETWHLRMPRGTVGLSSPLQGSLQQAC